MGGLDLFPAEPVARRLAPATGAGRSSRPRSTSRCARPGRSLAEALGREPRPVTFVVVAAARASPPRSSPCAARLEPLPDAALQARPDQRLDRRADRRAGGDRRGRLASTSRASTRARSSTQAPTPSSTAAWSRRSPTPGSRTPTLNAETEPVLEPHRDRITWDAPIHSIADIEALPFPPKMVNIKPSRLGGLQELLRRLRLLRGARHRRLRRRPVRARPGPRADPVPGLALPSRHAQRRGAHRLQPARPAAGCRRARSSRGRRAGLPLGLARTQQLDLRS